MSNRETASKRLAARVTHSFKEAFNQKAAQIGKNESEVLMELARKFINGEIQIDHSEGDRIQRLEEEVQSLKSIVKQLVTDKRSQQKDSAA